MNQRFPKATRLRSRREFSRLKREGQRKVGRYLCVDSRPADLLKLGITASTRYGSAVERNRFKRLVREAFRTSCLPPQELNILPRQAAKKACLCDVRNEILKLCC